KKEKSFFHNYSNGVVTARDSWVYQYSNKKLRVNISDMINFYNNELSTLSRVGDLNGKDVGDLIDNNPTKISWTRALKNDLKKGRDLEFDDLSIYVSMYRPFIKCWMYFNRRLNEMVYQMPQIFPFPNSENVLITLNVNPKKGFCVLLTDVVPDFHLLGDVQCFPLYVYESSDTGVVRKNAIDNDVLIEINSHYSLNNITNEDVFFYIYGLLHSNDYRATYKDNISKELPRIPLVKNIDDFFVYSNSGRELAELHLKYEKVEPYKADIDTGSLSYSQLGKDDFYVEKMKFAKKGEKDTVIYNNKIRIKKIPIEAYDYIVNGKPALEWVMERQGVSTHKDSGIVNDANDWAIETMNNPRYPLELFLRVITVSLETQRIVNSLPKLDI
ncbi:endonuclease, partial [Enterobacter hormaechei]|nr:endonuclease [Enterobacter hormaechei]